MGCGDRIVSDAGFPAELIDLISEICDNPQLLVEILNAQQPDEPVAKMADELAELRAAMVDQSKFLQLKLDALRPPDQEPTPGPDPLQSIDNVLNGLAQVVKRIDQLKAQIDLQNKGEATFTFDPSGTTRIKREDGTEMVIERDINRRQVRIRRR
jgi:hypothetical protein